MALYQEVKGSRRTWEDGKKLNAERLYIATTATDANVPSTGDYYVGDTDIAGRVCVSKNIDTEVIPGVFFFTLRYLGFKAYS